MKYKRVYKTVPWCYKCDQEIIGNGSINYPYLCKCGKHEFDEELREYKLKDNN